MIDIIGGFMTKPEDLKVEPNPLDIPRPLPIGLTEFHVWADRLIEIVGPLADSDSMKYVMASQIIHMPHDQDEVPDRHFRAALRKAAANQVASQVFQDIKLKQQEAAKAAAEATATTSEETAKAPSNNEKV